MKKMKKQYFAQVQFKYQEEKGEWANAMITSGKRNRFASSLREAKEAIAKCLNDFNKGSRVELSKIGGLGISTVIDEETAERLQIIKTRIRVREVTEWEDVE